MKTLDESVAQAMDGSGTAIVPFLPYILQDACCYYHYHCHYHQ